MQPKENIEGVNELMILKAVTELSTGWYQSSRTQCPPP